PACLTRRWPGAGPGGAREKSVAHPLSPRVSLGLSTEESALKDHHGYHRLSQRPSAGPRGQIWRELEAAGPGLRQLPAERAQTGQGWRDLYGAHPRRDLWQARGGRDRAPCRAVGPCRGGIAAAEAPR